MCFEVDRSDTVQDLKKLIQERTKIPAEKQRLLYCERQLEDHCTLLECQIQQDSTVHVVLRLKARGAPASISFVEVTSNVGPIRTQFDLSAPRWRRVDTGLNLEGRCRNSSCEANNCWAARNNSLPLEHAETVVSFGSRPSGRHSLKVTCCPSADL
ncbi:ubiquitin family-domain-containing protein [Cladochytrium replicatum]|nr:ubiquitin family-domain-containing protein [Cladochytrium replicatum]